MIIARSKWLDAIRRPPPGRSSPDAMPRSTCWRPPMRAAARSERVIGADPDGPPRHFCSPAVTMSAPHSSTGASMPPSVAVAST